MAGCYLVDETEGQPPGTQKDLKQEGTRANEKLANSQVVANTKSFIMFTNLTINRAEKSLTPSAFFT